MDYLIEKYPGYQTYSKIGSWSLKKELLIDDEEIDSLLAKHHVKSNHGMIAFVDMMRIVESELG